MATLVNFVMDETGSMASQGEEPVTGLNRYIDDLNADSRHRIHALARSARRHGSQPPWP